MTISSTNRKAGPFAGNDVTVAFPFAFKVFSDEDVLAVLASASNVETILMLATDYAVLLNANQDTNPGGTVTLIAALTTGTKLTLTSSVADLQPVTLTNNGGFYPRVINDALDRVTIQIQQLSEKVSRSLQWPISSASASLPTPEASKFIGWNAAADSLVNLSGVAVGDAQTVSITQAGTGAVTRSVQDKLRESVSVKDFGAVGDGVADDTAAIQLSINSNPARRIYLPKGTYKVSDTIWLKYDGQILEGESVGGYTFGQVDDTYGTTIQWNGAAGATVVLKVARFESTSAPYSFSGGGVRNLRIDCAGTNYAGTGLYVPDANNCVFEHIKIDQATQKGIDLTGYVPDVSGINSVYNCAFRDIQITVAGGGDGIYMGDTPNVGGGDHPAFVTFDNMHITYNTGTAINIYEGDDCAFNNIGISRVAGGTGDAIVIQGSGAHGNHFRCINVTQTDGTAPKIWVKTGVTAHYFELAGIDKNIRPTIDAGAEAYYLYLGSNNIAADAEFRSPVIRLPNINKGEATYLDWYEEGGFTPTLQFSGASVGITYDAGNTYGRYVRIGRTVFASLTMTLTSKGSSVGTAQVVSWPYSPSANNNQIAAVRPIGGWVAASVDRGVVAQVFNGLGTMLKNVSGVGGMSAMTDTDFSNTSSFTLTVAYEV